MNFWGRFAVEVPCSERSLAITNLHKALTVAQKALRLARAQNGMGDVPSHHFRLPVGKDPGLG